jgi:chorismate dehydratase
MTLERISASAYSNTAPLIWSFLYGTLKQTAELILDNAPARSAELLINKRVNYALVPVIASQYIPDVRLVPGVCVGAEKKVQSVCLITKGGDLKDARKIALDRSSRTSQILTKIIFREFFAREPEWIEAEPDINAMLEAADAALLIGDPTLSLNHSQISKHDLVELWRSYTGYGFVFAMWMTFLGSSEIDFALAREEGLAHIDEIAKNYSPQIGLSFDEMRNYLQNNICYTPSESMLDGLELYLKLANKCCLTPNFVPLNFIS